MVLQLCLAEQLLHKALSEVQQLTKNKKMKTLTKFLQEEILPQNALPFNRVDQTLGVDIFCDRFVFSSHNLTKRQQAAHVTRRNAQLYNGVFFIKKKPGVLSGLSCIPKETTNRHMDAADRNFQ